MHLLFVAYSWNVCVCECVHVWKCIHTFWVWSLFLRNLMSSLLIPVFLLWDLKKLDRWASFMCFWLRGKFSPRHLFYNVKSFPFQALCRCSCLIIGRDVQCWVGWNTDVVFLAFSDLNKLCIAWWEMGEASQVSCAALRGQGFCVQLAHF